MNDDATMPPQQQPHQAPLQPATFPAFITASGIDRFLACPASALLTWTMRKTSQAALQGTLEHEARLQDGKLPPRVLAWFGGQPRYEVALAADLAVDHTQASLTARFLGENIGRNYPRFPGDRWLAGASDTLLSTEDTLSIGDLKTGRGQAAGSLPRPRDSGQLLGLAYMAGLVRMRKGALPPPRRIRLMFWLTADHEEDIIDDEVTWDYIVSWSSRLCVKAMTATATRLSPGAYCGHCSSFDSCPAQGGALRRLADATGRLCSAEALGPAELGAAWRDLEAAERICATAKAALLARVEAGAVAAVDDGHALKLIRGSTSRVRADIAAEVLGDRFYEAATVTVSQEAIKRVGGEAALAAVREAGGIETAPKAPHLRAVKVAR